METARHIIEWAAIGIEVVTAIVLTIALTVGSVRYLWRLNRPGQDAYRMFRVRLGKTLILALEFLVAADIIRTVALEQTFQNVAVLGTLILIRTFLSWSLSVETEGHWPWSRESKSLTEDSIS